ncbi:MAG: 4Fe-4S binding protein [Deltaproteobacteria bacterium]|nr:4Fe-4S binding protein [Deltaproteobacteria bacterium]
MTDIYQKLAEFFDSFPQRFPKESEQGQKVLKMMISPEEAEMIMRLEKMPEAVSTIAQRLERDEAELGEYLYALSKKGLIMRIGREGNYFYMATAFAVGIIEFYLNSYTTEIADEFDKFHKELFEGSWMKGITREIRTVPVGESVVAGTEILPYENAEALIKSQKRIAVSECMCAIHKGLKSEPEPCEVLTERCFQFGGAAFFFVENNLSRWISQEEALEIVKKSTEAGCIAQPGQSQNSGGMCMCCPCCCGPLDVYRDYDKRSEISNSNFYARVDEKLCSACETCLDRCPMDAITMEGTALVTLDLCIGCGVCAVTCDDDAIKTYKKEASKRFIPEPDYMSSIMKIYEERK